jgi:hypothetical protein
MAQPLSLNEFMKAFCYGDPEVKSSGAVTHRGSSAYLDGYQIGSRVPAGCYEASAWRDGHHRFVWLNDDERYTITYCEGDVIVVVCPDVHSYADEFREASVFYQTH